MARPRIIPDADILAAVLLMISEQGERAVAFSSVSRATRLAGPTLVQRFGSLDGMIRAALGQLLDEIDARLDAAEAAAPVSAKGAQVLLKALGDDAHALAPAQLLPAILRDPVLRDRLALWRARVEAALALRLGGGDKGREAAGLLFAAWQGDRLWRGTGEKGFRLKDAIKAVT